MQVVAEVGLTEGSLGMAMAMIGACADAGVDCVKGQCHLGDTCNTFRPETRHLFCQDRTRQDYWERTGFTRQQWEFLAGYARGRGLLFSCSIFSLAGLEMMAPLCDQIKVPSSKTNDHELLRDVAKTGKPIVLSTGMSDYAELERAEKLLWEELDYEDVTILDCVSEYPTPPERVLVSDFDGRFSTVYKYGLSDHSGEIWPGIIAAVRGCDMLECHVCWSKEQWGPDVAASLTIEQLRQLVAGIRFVERMPRQLDKDELAKQLEPVRRVFRG